MTTPAVFPHRQAALPGIVVVRRNDAFVAHVPAAGGAHHLRIG